MPKTIDQCIKLAKSRPRPASIRPYCGKAKRQPLTVAINETQLKRSNSTQNTAFVKACRPKESLRLHAISHGKAVSSSEDGTDTTLFEIANASHELCQKRELLFKRKNFEVPKADALTNEVHIVEENETSPEKSKTLNGVGSFSNIYAKQAGHEADAENEENDDECEEETSENVKNKLMDTISLLSCSSSLIENGEINYDDSLQDNSFDSDRQVLFCPFKM